RRNCSAVIGGTRVHGSGVITRSAHLPSLIDFLLDRYASIPLPPPSRRLTLEFPTSPGQCASSSAYTARVASLTVSHEYRALAYSRIPFRRLLNVLNRSLWKYDSMVLDRSSESRALHKNPVSPWTISSLKDPTSAAITGSPNPYPKMSTPLWNTSVY